MDGMQNSPSLTVFTERPELVVHVQPVPPDVLRLPARRLDR